MCVCVCVCVWLQPRPGTYGKELEGKPETYLAKYDYQGVLLHDAG